MSNSPPKLRGYLSKLQRSAVKYYVLMAQRFERNHLIRESWAAMAGDLEKQADSLKRLPHSFWKRLNDDGQELLQAVESVPALEAKGALNGTLHDSFVQTLDFEEPVIIRLYAPLIYRLRADRNDRAVDLYIVVKAHLVRMLRLIQPISGDPGLIQRCSRLMERFEREAQEQKTFEAQPARRPGRRPVKTRAKSPADAVRPVSRTRTQAKRQKGGPAPRPLGNRAKRAKALVKNIKISRRRIQR